MIENIFHHESRMECGCCLVEERGEGHFVYKMIRCPKCRGPLKEPLEWDDLEQCYVDENGYCWKDAEGTIPKDALR